MVMLTDAGVGVLIPEIADYEVRRELLRAGLTSSVRRLDALKDQLGYLPLTTEMMLLAAHFWAQARQSGRPTAGGAALDGDVILAAQATVVAAQGDEAIVATTNLRHLARFVTAMLWQDITPGS
jgi:hypothetical protein